METIKKNDFIELEFLGKIKGGDVFDTNIESEAKRLGYKDPVKPLVLSAGNMMTIKGLDDSLEGKEIGKEYEIEIAPKEGFGIRDSKLVRTYPLKAFLEKNINPYPGLVLALDTTIAKVISVSGGRVILDFNNPLAGKILIYKFKILRKIEVINDKVKALRDFFYQQEFEFEIQDKKIIFKAQEPFEKFILIYKDKFKEMLGLDLGFEKKEAKEENKENPENKKEEASSQDESV